MKQLINFKNPFTGKRQAGVITPGKDEVSSTSGQFSLKKLKKTNQDGGIGYHETRDKGKIIQKSGEFHG